MVISGFLQQRHEPSVEFGGEFCVGKRPVPVAGFDGEPIRNGFHGPVPDVRTKGLGKLLNIKGVGRRPQHPASVMLGLKDRQIEVEGISENQCWAAPLRKAGDCVPERRGIGDHVVGYSVNSR